MPRVTPRQVALISLTAVMQYVNQLFIILNNQKLLDGKFRNLNEHKDLCVALLLYEHRLKRLHITRYVTPREHCYYSTWVYELDLRKVDGEVPWLTDREFLLKY